MIPRRNIKLETIPKPRIGLICLVKLNNTPKVITSPIMKPIAKSAVALPLELFFT